MNRAEVIAALVTDKFSGLKDEDQPMLEGCSEARLEEFRAAGEQRKREAQAAVKLENENRNLAARVTVLEAKVKESETELTDEQFLARAPKRFKEVIETHEAGIEAQKLAIVTQLKDLGAHTEEQLREKSLEELEMLASYARIPVPDFSGRGVSVPQSRNAADKQSIKAPDPYRAALEAQRARESKVH